MLNNKRQNFHHSKLPELGAIVEVHTQRLQQGETYKKFIVESFNLCDNPQYRGNFYSVGIHLVNLAELGNRNNKQTVSGFWCETIG